MLLKDSNRNRKIDRCGNIKEECPPFPVSVGVRFIEPGIPVEQASRLSMCGKKGLAAFLIQKVACPTFSIISCHSLLITQLTRRLIAKRRKTWKKNFRKIKNN
jgi:hypothetical protein